MLTHSVQSIVLKVTLFGVIILSVAVVSAKGNDQYRREHQGASYARDAAQLWLKGSHGYRVTVRISQRSAQLIVRKAHTASIYMTHNARLRHRELFARFGELGRFHMRFDREGGWHKRRDACGSNQRSVAGVFHGYAHFRGEGDFTEISAKSAVGIMTSGRKEHCEAAAGRAYPDPTASRSKEGITVFSLGGRGYTRVTGGRYAVSELKAWETKLDVQLGSWAIARSAAPFSASRSLRSGGVEIVRLVAAAGTQGALSIGSHAEATVKPPAPFRGVGRLEACRLGSWAGDLTANFPGEEVDLTCSNCWVRVYPVARNGC